MQRKKEEINTFQKLKYSLTSSSQIPTLRYEKLNPVKGYTGEMKKKNTLFSNETGIPARTNKL